MVAEVREIAGQRSEDATSRSNLQIRRYIFHLHTTFSETTTLPTFLFDIYSTFNSRYLSHASHLVAMASSRQEERNSPSPPPPAPPPLNPSSKISPYVLKLKNAPPDYFYQAPEKLLSLDLFAAPTGPYFFYGILIDPLMIAEILNLAGEPKLRPAYIVGYECKMWGQYPALLDSPGSIVEGAAYHVRTTQDGERLAVYETGNYCAEPCLLRYTDGKEPSEDLGYTFKFVGDLSELSEGEFDLKVWLRRMGRQAAANKLDVGRSEM